MFNFHQIILFIGSIVLLVAFILSLNIGRRYTNLEPLNNFFIILFISLCLTINTIFTNVLKYYSVEVGGLLETVLMMFDFLFWVYFFSVLGIKFTSNKIYKSALFAFLTLMFALIFINYGTTKFYHYSISFFFLAEIIFCILYINRIFSEPSNQMLTKNPIFLIVTGLLIKCVVGIPTLLASEIMFVGNNSKFYMIIFPISNVAILFMYGQFIHAFICIRREYEQNYKGI